MFAMHSLGCRVLRIPGRQLARPARATCLVILAIMGARGTAGREYDVVFSGGPGVYEPRDPKHDASWANYVTKPLLDLPPAIDRPVYWIIYRPAYVERWADDSTSKHPDRRKAAQEVLDKGSRSYVHHLERRAREKGWELKWIDSAAEFWAIMRASDPTIRTFRYYGHARHNLWMDLNHNAAGEPVSPEPHAIVQIADIVASFPKGSSLFRNPESEAGGALGVGGASRSSSNQRESGEAYFFGCNTAQFAEIWAGVFRVKATGIHGDMMFGDMQDNDPRRRVGFTPDQVREYGVERQPPLPSAMMIQ
jgi:hypothetical protein